MKKILLLSFLVTPFLLGGCNNKKIDGPTNKYFQKYSFKRTANEDEGIKDYNAKYFVARMYDVSNIDEVEEQYSYLDGKEEFTSYKSNTEFFTNSSASERYRPYISETNTTYSHTKNKVIETYTSNIVKWNGIVNSLFTVETIKRDGNEEKKYGAVTMCTEDAFKELYKEPVGKPYFDRKNNLCYYTEVIEKFTKEDINNQTYVYAHKEQAIYIYDGTNALLNYHYYDEVVSNKDPETGNFYDNERIISYHYHEINYRYDEKQIRNTDGLNRLLDGHEFVSKVDITHIINRYQIENGEYNFYDGITSYDHLDYETEYDSNGNYTYTTYIPCYDSPLYLDGTEDGLANRLQYTVEFIYNANACGTLKGYLSCKGYEELFKKYGIDIIKNATGDYFIFTKPFDNPPLLAIKLKVEMGDATKVTLDLDIVTLPPDR